MRGNIQREYKIMKVVVCDGVGGQVPYINHIVMRGPNGGCIVFNKDDSERFMRGVIGQHGAPQIVLVNMAINLGKNGNCLSVVPYVKPKDVNYTMVAKSYNARLADRDTVKAAIDFTRSTVLTSMVTK